MFNWMNRMAIPHYIPQNNLQIVSSINIFLLLILNYYHWNFRLSIVLYCTVQTCKVVFNMRNKWKLRHVFIRTGGWSPLHLTFVILRSNYEIYRVMRITNFNLIHVIEKVSHMSTQLDKKTNSTEKITSNKSHPTILKTRTEHLTKF